MDAVNTRPLEAAGFTPDQRSAIVGIVEAVVRLLTADQKKEFLSRQDLIDMGMPRSTVDALGRSDRFSEFGFTNEKGRKVFIFSRLLRHLELMEDERMAGR